jgi:NADPH-dependent 2,4-dienoyl-CoA reductase/sulfur reductase-like enzyme
VIIVGAGPAGISAAAVLVDHGIRPLLLDEARRPGGQAYRKARDPLRVELEALLGSEIRKYRRIHQTFEVICEELDYAPETLVWSIFQRELHALSRGRSRAHTFDALILAPGAVDRVLPIEGWTLPGVVTLGAAQILLKDQASLIGRRVVFCGSSPLLYLAALQYRRMGAEVTVLDTTPFVRKIAALPDLLASPVTFRRGLGYLATLRRLGVPVRHGVRLLRFGGSESVDHVAYRDSAGERRVDCDAVALGFGLRPETQLAELAGCQLAYDSLLRQWLPVCDAEGRGGAGIYVAGDGSTISGADAAEIGGRLAGYAVLEDLGVPSGEREQRPWLHRRLARLRRFQRGLATAFAWPHEWARDIGDEVLVCRCEEVTAGVLRQALRADFGPREINRLKAFTRCGMGRCQGRFCSLAASELAAAALGRPHRDMGWLRAQGPVKPLLVATALDS